MTLFNITLLFLVTIFAGYFIYGSRLKRIFGLSNDAVTPAHTMKDDQEFIPTHPFYLFCQHFSAIAASGPIAGPILACQRWGFVPCLLWITIGVIFIGAVHDFSALAVSVRHKAGSVALIVKEQIGDRAGWFFLAFIWIALIYIIIAFTEVTASSFVSSSEELQNITTTFNKGGAVASASLFYLIICLIMGLIMRFTKMPLWLNTVIFVPAVFAATWLGTYFSHWFLFELNTFLLIIIFYCAISSLIPVWILLQPRGYLGGFVLIFVLLVGIIGLIFGSYEIKQPAFIASDDALGSPLLAERALVFMASFAEGPRPSSLAKSLMPNL
jgi:carbon starvation protein